MMYKSWQVPTVCLFPRLETRHSLAVRLETRYALAARLEARYTLAGGSLCKGQSPRNELSRLPRKKGKIICPFLERARKGDNTRFTLLRYSRFQYLQLITVYKLIKELLLFGQCHVRTITVQSSVLSLFKALSHHFQSSVSSLFKALSHHC